MDDSGGPYDRRMWFVGGGYIMRGEAWVAVADKSRASFTKVVATLGRECREWPEGATQSKIRVINEEHCGDDEMIVYADGSVQRATMSG